MLNKYFIAQIAENIFILQWKKVKTGTPDYPSLGEIEIQISRLFFLALTYLFRHRNENKGKRKVQGVPQSQAEALPRHQVEKVTDRTKQAQIEQTYEKH